MLLNGDVLFGMMLAMCTNRSLWKDSVFDKGALDTYVPIQSKFKGVVVKQANKVAHTIGLLKHAVNGLKKDCIAVSESGILYEKQRVAKKAMEPSC